MEGENDANENKKDGQAKKGKKSKKRLFKAILKQMEFYFTDSNLARDKFLMGLINENPEGNVDLDAFLKFNMIKALTQKVEDIAKSLERSDFLMLSQDRKSVKRLTEIKIKDNVDECVIYVENVPPNCDRDWVKNAFKGFGQIDYVHLPKFRNSEMNKGFAFVEFNSKEGAESACKYFNAKPSDDPDSEEECARSELLDGHKRKTKSSKRKSDETRTVKNEQDLKRKLGDSHLMAGVEEKTDRDDTKKSKQIKPNEPESHSGKRNLKRKLDGTDKGTGNRKADEVCGKKSKLDRKQVDAAESEPKFEAVPSDSEKEMTEIVDVKAKKRRKRGKRKPKERIVLENLHLRVIPRSEWKRLKNKYLAIQKANMAQVKQLIAASRKGGDGMMDEFKNETKRQEVPVEDSKVPKVRAAPSFVPGVIVKLTVAEPFTDVKPIRSEFRMIPGVVFAEIMEESTCGYIRCESKEHVDNVVKTVQCKGTVSVLKGEEEKEYWELLLRKRDEKLNNKSKKPKVRGFDKLMRRAVIHMEANNKHLRFD